MTTPTEAFVQWIKDQRPGRFPPALPKFSKPNAPPPRTRGETGSQFKLFLQRKRLSRILGQQQVLNIPSLLGG